MSAGLHALSDDYVHSCVPGTDRCIDGTNLVDDRHARGVSGRYIFRWIAPEERKGGDALGDAHFDSVLRSEMEDEIHPEGPGCERPKIPNLTPQRKRRG